MAQLNDFMTRIDLSVLNDYVAANGKGVVYAKGDSIVQQGCLCRYVGVVQSGYFKYMALNSKGQEVVTGFSCEDEEVTDYVQGFLYDQPSLTSIVAGCEAEVQRVSGEGSSSDRHSAPQPIPTPSTSATSAMWEPSAMWRR